MNSSGVSGLFEIYLTSKILQSSQGLFPTPRSILDRRGRQKRTKLTDKGVEVLFTELKFEY